ncbi:MAG: FAD-dependent oxidoreductase [marine benthic group bacterium]|nr:FAD-dependent oxidoreductase [Candidatus Carthagonibacter metallireducens]
MNQSGDAARTAHDVAFPRLNQDEIEQLRTFGTARSVVDGEELFRAGDRGFDFFVVLDGKVEITESSSGEKRDVALHVPGEFTGDVDMLTGRGSLVTARMIGHGEVLSIPPDVLRDIVGQIPEVGETLLRAFLMRRTLLLDGGFEGLKIIGSRFSPDAHRLRDFATRNAVPFTWLDLERETSAEALLQQFGFGPGDTPVVIGSDGSLLRNPSLAEFAASIGLDAQAREQEIQDLIVVGVGPAGLAAAVYAASEGLKVLAVDAHAVGGQAATTTRIENYLGFPAGVTGSELTQKGMLQAQKFGAGISVPARACRLRVDRGLPAVDLEDGRTIVGRCILIATGADYVRLPVPELERFEGAGVYYAATATELRLCRSERVGIVGGGNSAGQAAVYLSRISEQVDLMIRGDDLGKSMSRYLIDQIEQTPNIQVRTHTTVRQLGGGDRLEWALLETPAADDEEIPLTALFVFIGARPRTEWLSGCVDLDERGFVRTGDEALDPAAELPSRWASLGRTPFVLETSLPGVFAAGDVRSGSVKRIASAVGEGSMAISLVHRHLAAVS